ncbi:hypothetical protein GGS23DRAFT_149096 [Durotheca rogersii]|uniref:uncharacterized protein n=1 Tax=Durotheca rogersii TaxID=419775 RepID=UPI00221E3A57|nr:uncharacterized protein GGS23DRAFT_149096 [Durotheca rogersii]KAI5861397.1 hypothetical protein GGS23DRAFT_149096 [Durotheca rogersii]
MNRILPRCWLFPVPSVILALFGEQFATQFTSQSMTWIDHLIFAMVPLGIVTVISGAIRVSGPRMAKAFIGRARENRTLAEIELMSSISAEVCEMFNGNSIVRVMGKPKTAHFLLFPELDDILRHQKNNACSSQSLEDSCGIHTIGSAYRKGLMVRETYHSESYHFIIRLIKAALKNPAPVLSSLATNYTNFICGLLRIFPQRTKELNVEEGRPEQSRPEELRLGAPRLEEPRPENKSQERKPTQLQGPTSYPDPPNIQINLVSGNFGRKLWFEQAELIGASLVAVTIQLGLIAIAAITVFHPEVRSAIGTDPEAYGFSSYAAGSILLSLGIGLCSCSIEQSTTEFTWKLKEDDNTNDQQDGKTNDQKDDDGGKGTDNKTCDNKESTKPENIGNPNKYPRLIFIQQAQTVQDMKFDSYVILAGQKRHILTSNRKEDAETDVEPPLERKSPSHENDTENKTKPPPETPKPSRNPATELATEIPPGRGIRDRKNYKETVIEASSPGEHGSGSKKSFSTQENPKAGGNWLRQAFSPRKRWELLTLIATLTSVVGFIAQFIGLRGLTYPCAIAQLLAICSMAFIRAWIRRKVGRVPRHSLASPGYELDFLAVHIVFCPKFRDPDQDLPEKDCLLKHQPHDLILRWGVSTPRLSENNKKYFKFIGGLASHHIRVIKTSLRNVSRMQRARIC